MIVKRFRGPQFSRSKTGLEVANLSFEVADAPLVASVLCPSDEPDIARPVTFVDQDAVQLFTRLVPARKSDHVAEKSAAIRPPLCADLDASAPVVVELRVSRPMTSADCCGEAIEEAATVLVVRHNVGVLEVELARLAASLFCTAIAAGRAALPNVSPKSDEGPGVAVTQDTKAVAAKVAEHGNAPEAVSSARERVLPHEASCPASLQEPLQLTR